jgi:putative nucleotidyltransferase with HDIG domain
MLGHGGDHLPGRAHLMEQNASDAGRGPGGEGRAGADSLPASSRFVPRILAVDDDPALLKATERTLRDPRRLLDVAASGAEALELVTQHEYAVLITDVRMPDMDGIELCERVRRRSPDTVCVLVTGHADIDVALSAINRAQVFRFLTKPWERDDLLMAVVQACDHHRIVREHADFSRLLGRRNLELAELNRKLDGEVQRRTGELLLGLINALDLRDTETQGHSRRVALYARRLAEQMHLGAEDVRDVERGALLHDIGKIGVSDTILLKPGKLTDEEWVEMRKHALHGYEILRGIEFLGNARLVVRSHHERFDGQGYPDGLAKEGIPIGARIFAVIDTYDAMTSDRPYRKALPASVAREEIQKHTGAQFDPACADAFLGIPQPELDEMREQVATNDAAGLE